MVTATTATGRSGARVLAWALAVGLACLTSIARADDLPEGFVHVDEIPGLHVDLRYFGTDNFVGRRVAGYEANRLILTAPAAAALARVQAELDPFGLGLLVYDGYRPQRAVDDFVRWAEDLEDTRTKARFYPDVPKSALFERGYIAARSSHSRGSTVDLTIVTVEDDRVVPLDMGTPFDFFSPKSWPDSRAVSVDARTHRALLRAVMTKHGFRPLEQEWWHFTLVDEPFPKTAFDFPIR